MLSVLDDFFVLYGLDINKAKTMLTLFGRQEDKYPLVERVDIKGCTKITLLGLDLDQCLEEMNKKL